MAEASTENENDSPNPFKSVLFNFVQNVVKFPSPYPLERLAVIRIVISLWQQEDIKEAIIHLFRLSYKGFELHRRSHWAEIEEAVCCKVSELGLAEVLKEVAQRTIKILGNDLLTFLEFESRHDPFTNNQIKLYLKNIQWTLQGTIDRRKTILRLIEKTRLSNAKKYSLACNYCLEDKIVKLVQKIPVYFHDVSGDDTLAIFWFFHFRGTGPKVQKKFGKIMVWIDTRDFQYTFTDLEEVFEKAISENNEVAVQHFWEKLAHEEMKRNAVKFSTVALVRKKCGIACYLLSQLKPSQEILFFRNFEANILKLLLDSEQWQEMFVPVVSYLCEFVWNLDWFRIAKIVSLFNERKVVRGINYEKMLEEWSRYRRSLSSCS